MKNIIVIIAVILLCSCGVENSYEDNPTTSNEVSKLVELKAFDTLVTLTAHDSLFIINDKEIVKSIPLSKYEHTPSKIVLGTIIIIALFLGLIFLLYLECSE